MTKKTFCALVAAVAVAASGSAVFAQAGNGCASAVNVSASVTVDGPTFSTTPTDPAGFSSEATDCGPPAGEASAWWSLSGAMFPAGTIFSASTFGTVAGATSFGPDDSAIEVLTGPCGGAQTVIGCNDDHVFFGQGDPSNILAGRVVWTNDGSSTYFIHGAQWADAGPSMYVLSVSATSGGLPANDTCGSAAAINNSSFPINASLTGAELDGANGIVFGLGVEVFYDFTAESNGGYTFTLTPSDANDDLGLFQIGFQDCDLAGSFAFFDAGGAGAAEVSDELIMFANDQYTFSVFGNTPTDDGRYDFTLNFVAGSSVDEWEAY